LHRQVAFRPDLIIALELIEHVPDPGAFLAELTRTLAPGGSILVSTPNRTNWGTTALWQTDLPPIHLHWFSELGMEALADGVGYCCEFTDFKRFNAFSARRRLGIGEAAVRAPLITADFDVVAPVSGRRENLLSTRIAPPMAVAVRMLQGRTTDRNRSGSMVVRLKAAYPNRPKSSGKGLTEQIGLA
jgi:SAM-dependent methyltransferase